ncbi:MAG: hypothetical protein AAGD04_04965 [Pseudomonadota bacterium]
MKTLMLAALLSITGVAAQAVTVGNDLINRPSADGWGNFSMIYTDLTLSEGTLTSWSAYGARSGLASLLVVSENAGTPGTGYNVEGVFDMTLTAGQVTTTAINFDVEDGWLLGLYQGAGRVDFRYSRGPTNIRFTPNNAGQPTAGTLLATPNGRNNQVRTYSFSAELAAVPLPAALPLLGLSLLGLCAMGRRRVLAA